MSSKRQPRPKPEVSAPVVEPALPANRPLSKKNQILTLFTGGITDVHDLAVITHSRPSYVAGVLQDNNLLTGYFDLYTHTGSPMNIHSKFFAGKLGFKDVETARQSVALIDHLYRQFATAEDRAGQHHSLVMALTMFDRARWTGKGEEAEVFRRWLADRLAEERAPARAEADRPITPARQR
jgi:hypothetical protein